MLSPTLFLFNTFKGIYQLSGIYLWRFFSTVSSKTSVRNCEGQVMLIIALLPTLQRDLDL